jgi:hypothetical protein
MPIRSGSLLCAVLVGFSLGTSSLAWSLEGPGLSPSEKGWWVGEWQTRIERGANLKDVRTLGGYNIATHARGQVQSSRSISLLGDYYFNTLPREPNAPALSAGFRATSGLWGTYRPPWSAAANSAATSDFASMPYVGLGYTEHAGLAGWGFSADFGLMALSPRSNVKFGRSFGGGAANIDDLLRDLRFSPLIQIGVSYSF